MADVQSAGVRDNYDVVYDWADNIGKGELAEDKCVFTREFGEMVDDWYAHNNINRAARSWGELLCSWQLFRSATPTARCTTASASL